MAHTETPNGEQPRAPESRSHAAAVCLAGLALVFLLFKGWDEGLSMAGIDFYQFWVVGQAITQFDVPNIYSETDRQRVGAVYLHRAAQDAGARRQQAAANLRKTLETYSTPFLYTVFYCFSSGNYERDYRTYQFLSMVCLLAGLGLLCSVLNCGALTCLVAAVLFSGLYEPCLWDLKAGNVNRIQFLVLALYLSILGKMTWRHSDLLAGFVMGLGVMFKPNIVYVPAMLGVLWLLRREYRKGSMQAVGAAAGVVFAWAVSSLVFGGPECWVYWLNALSSMPSGIIRMDMANYALSQWFRAYCNGGAATFIAPVLWGLTLVVFWHATRTPDHGGDRDAPDSAPPALAETQMLALGCLLYLLTASLVWGHYLVLAIPAILVAMYPAARTASRAAWARGAVIAVAVLLMAQSPFVLKQTRPEQTTLMINAGLLVLYVLLVVQARQAFKRSVTRRPDAEPPGAERPIAPATSEPALGAGPHRAVSR